MVSPFRIEIVRVVLGGVGVRLAGMVVSFALQIVLARLLGASEYGAFVYAMTLASMLALLLSGGLDLILLRVCSPFQVGSSSGFRLPRGFATSLAQVASWRGLVAIVVGTGIWWWAKVSSAIWKDAFQVLALASVLMVLSGFVSAMVQAKGKAVLAQVLGFLASPLVLLVFLGILRISGFSADTAVAVALLQVCSLLIVLVFAVRWLLPIHVESDAPVDGLKAEARNLFLFVLLGFLIAKIDTLLVGTLAGMADVGIYNVALRLAELVSLFLAASNMHLAPRIAALVKEERFRDAEALIHGSMKVVMACTAVIGILLAMFGPWVLSWYGKGFEQALVPMLILMAGHLANVALGPVGYFLAMANRSDLLVRGYAWGCVVAVVASLVLIPPYGLPGAAAANALAMISWNFFLWNKIRQCYSINVAVFPWRDAHGMA